MSSAHASKRRLHETYAEAEYAPGAIKRIKLHNFMSYVDAEVHNPGPRLNCIVGPNGTGKSSIVNALAIGLGGSLRLTERGSNAEDAIKKDCDSGFVEIELRAAGGPGKNLVVRCDLKREGKKIDYSLDGKHVSAKEVKERMAGLGIQIENMLQFLPQDKVAAFTTMKPTELLTNTMRATLPEEAAEHQELIRLSKHAVEMAAGKEEKQRELARLEDKQAKLQADVDRLNELRANEKKQSDLLGKAAWLKVIKLRDESNAKRDAARVAKAARKAAEAAANAVEAPLRAARDEAAEAAKAKAKADAASTASETARAALRADIEQRLLLKIDELDGKLADVDERGAERKAVLARAEANVAKLRATLPPAPVVDPAAQRELERELSEATNQKGDALAAKEAVERRSRPAGDRLARAEQALRALDSVAERRLALLGRNPDGAKALQLRAWVAQNASLFEDEVIGPIGLECEATDELGGKYLEAAVNRNILTGFLCFSPKDRDLLMGHIRQHRLGLNAYRVPRGQRFAPPYDARAPALAALGVEGWLADRLRARAEVAAFLSDFSGIGRILVGSQELGGRMEALSETLRAQFNADGYSLYIPTTSFTASRSRYAAADGQRRLVTASKPQRPPRDGYLFFNAAAAADPDERARVAAELADARELVERLRADAATAQRRIEEAEAIVHNARQAKRAVADGARALAAAAARLSAAERARDDAARDAAPETVARERKVLAADLAKLFDRVAARVAELAKAHEAHVASGLDGTCAALAARAAAERIGEATEAARDARDKAKSAAREEEALVAAKKRVDDELFRRVKEATEAAPHFQAATDAAGLSGADKDSWDGLPDDDDALAEELAAIGTLLARSVADKDSLRLFSENARKIAALTETLGEYEAQVASRTDELRRRREAWEPKVRQMAQHVSAKFSEYFAAFKCVGEVELAVAPQMEDYALNIMVKWRPSEELHALSDGGRDSGGERSVATMVYLIALQDVNPCPFRVVDEINQAMDPTNERRIFECITRAVASQSSKTQYFLITPKLLPDLSYTAQTSVLFIYNGPYMRPASEFMIEDHSGRKTERRQSASPDDEDE